MFNIWHNLGEKGKHSVFDIKIMLEKYVLYVENMVHINNAIFKRVSKWVKKTNEENTEQKKTHKMSFLLR